MSRIHEGLNNIPFNKPADIVTETVCAKSGKLPNELCQATLKVEYFTPDTVPTETCDVHYSGIVCAYSALPAADSCPFAAPGVLEMAPENERLLAGQATVNEDGTVSNVCMHDALFMAQPGAEAVIDQQRLELELRATPGSFETQFAQLQQELQDAVVEKAEADNRVAAAADDTLRAEAQAASDAAQAKIDALNNRIALLQAAQNAAVAAQAAETPPASSTGGEG